MWKSQGDFIVMLADDPSQNNSHCDFSVESPRNDILWIIMGRIKISLIFTNVVTVTFLTTYDIKQITHQSAVIQEQYLFTKSDVYIIFFYVRTCSKIVC